MFVRTLKWFFCTGLLVLVLVLTASITGQLAAGPPANTVSAQGDIARGADASVADSVAAWRNNGPYGGNARAVAMSPSFRTDGFALAGGWRQGHYGITGGYGIARTTDGGASWQLLQDEQHRWPVFDLAISPGFSADGTAYAGTEVGLLRTTDRGDNWLTLWGGLPGCEKESICGIWRVRLSPNFTSDGTMLALQRQGALYLSTNRGDAWMPITSGPQVFAATFSPDFATNQVIFAAQFDGTGATRLLRSADLGATWAELLTLPATQVNDILETVEGSLLLATNDGVIRLVPDGVAYVEEPVPTDIPGPVERLTRGGDNIFAAAQDGLYISMSFGRGWERYDATPQMPFRAVAWGGGGRMLMAGADTGILFTPDDNWVPWRWLPGPRPVDARSVAAYGEGTLFVASDQGVFRSTNNGASWQLLTAGASLGDDIGFLAVQPSPSYAVDSTVFATFVNRTLETTALYKSTDGGATWSVIPGIGGRGLALSNNYLTDHTVFVANGDRLYKSTDGGATWATYPIAPPEDYYMVYELAASPAYASDQTLFATGYMGTRRSTDGGLTWSAVGGPAPSYGLALSPAFAADNTAWLTFRFIEGVGDGTPDSGVARTTNRGGSWSLVTAGLPGTYEPFPIPLAASPNYASDRALFTALAGQFVAGEHHSLYRAIGGGNWWVDLGPAPGNPDMRDLAVSPLGPAGGLTAHAATSAGVWHCDALCEERLINGGFEVVDLGWQRPTTPATAQYSTKYVHAGERSLRTGIDGGTNVYSYSSVNQSVTIPSTAISATLTFWWYPISGEGPLSAADEAAPDPVTLQRAVQADAGLAAASLAPDSIASSDRQYVLLLRTDGTVLKTLMWTRSNAQAWQKLTFDLSAYKGQTFRVAFGTYNDGLDGATAMYVDDASVVICWPEPSVKPLVPRAYLPLVLNNYVGPTPSPEPYPLQERWLRSLVVAPGESGRLYGITNEGYLMTSSDRGATWTTMPLPIGDDGLWVHATAIGMDYSHPETLYLSAATDLWRSVDGGANWEKRSSGIFGPVTVDFDDPNALWSGNPAPARSTDAGATWWPANEGFDGTLASPILIDPHVHDLRYAVSQSTDGGGRLYRRTGTNMWDVMDGAPVGGSPEGFPSPGLALAGETRALYLGNPNGTLYVSVNPYALTKTDIVWTPVASFLHQPIPLVVGGSPLDGALYITLNDYTGNMVAPGRTLRSDDGGVTWIALTIPAATGVPTATPTPTATATPTPACYEGFVNGGFETDAGWLIKSNPVLAAYVTTPVHSGTRSMRTGIPAGGANTYSYSPIEQAVTFPAGLASATLSFWRYNVNGDVTAVAAGWQPDPAALPRSEAEQGDNIQAADYFYAIAILPEGTIDYLFTETTNTPSWRQRTIALNVSRYAGKTIRFQFGTYNNGQSGISRTFVDDASLTLCPTAAATATPTVTPTVTRTPTATLTRTPTATPMATPPGSVTPFPTPAGYPTAPAQTWPTPYKLRTLDLGPGSHPHGVAVNPAGDRAYIALHGVDHSGRELMVVDTVAWTIPGTVQLDTQPAGPNGVAIVPLSGMPLGYLVGVTNRQTDEVVLVDPASWAIHRRFSVGDMPDGVIQQGNYYYVANYGNDTVTVFAMSSLDPVASLGVGHEPALFAGDPATNDVFLSLHGANKIARIHDRYVAQEYPDIPEPYGLAFDPTDHRLYVANRGSHHKVTVLDINTGAVVGAIDIGREPYVVAVNPDSGHLFVACGDEVRVYDTFDWAFIASIPVPAGAEEGIAVDSGRDLVYVTSREGDALTVIQDAGPAQVLFTSDRDNNTEIYRMLPDGRQQQRLTFTADASETGATGSPDGRWIAYSRNMPDDTWQLWVMSRNGRNSRNLASGGTYDSDPSWSPDGKYLAFGSYRGDNWDIYKIEIATGLVTRLTTDAVADSAPDWSWANDRIAFQSNRGGPNPELYSMAADGSDVRKITTNINGDAAPSWNPAGTQLAFWSTRAEQTIYRTESDGTGIVPLVSGVVRPGSSRWGRRAAANWIVFSGYRPGSGHSEVFRMNADGSGLMLLTWNETDFDSATGWLPSAPY